MFFAAKFAEVAVVSHEPAKRRRIMLVEQQLHAFLLTAGIGCAHLGLQLPGFVGQLCLPDLKLRTEFGLLFLAEIALPLELFQVNARFRDLHLG